MQKNYREQEYVPAPEPGQKAPARIKNANLGRTGELRSGERWRGDAGGGRAGDGIPDVPHGEVRDEDEQDRKAPYNG